MIREKKGEKKGQREKIEVAKQKQMEEAQLGEIFIIFQCILP